jgi:hypothetical protein
MEPVILLPISNSCACQPGGARHQLRAVAGATGGARACQLGCLPAAGLLVLARQVVLVGYWPLAKGATGGARRAGHRAHQLLSLHRCSPNAALAASRRCSPSAVPPLGYRRHCLRWGTGELHVSSPTFTPISSSAMMSLHLSKQQGDIALESVYCKCMFQVFHMSQRCFTSVSHRCCKSRSGCCTCCNSYTCMFQV